MARISVTHMGKTVEYQKRGEDWVITDGEDIPVYDPEWQGTPLLLSFPRATLVSSTIDDLGLYGLDDPPDQSHHCHRHRRPYILCIWRPHSGWL